MILSLGSIWKTSSTINVAKGLLSNSIVSSSPISRLFKTSMLVLPEGARMKGNGKVFPSIKPVFKTLWLSLEFIKEVAGARRPSFSNSKAEAASVSIKRVLFFLDDVIFLSFFP